MKLKELKGCEIMGWDETGSGLYTGEDSRFQNEFLSNSNVIRLHCVVVGISSPADTQNCY
jgi:hypothetical protein